MTSGNDVTRTKSNVGELVSYVCLVLLGVLQLTDDDRPGWRVALGILTLAWGVGGLAVMAFRALRRRA